RVIPDGYARTSNCAQAAHIALSAWARSTPLPPAVGNEDGQHEHDLRDRPEPRRIGCVRDRDRDEIGHDQKHHERRDLPPAEWSALSRHPTRMPDRDPALSAHSGRGQLWPAELGSVRLGRVANQPRKATTIATMTAKTEVANAGRTQA